MDRVVVRKRIDKRILIGGGAAAVLLLVLLFWLFAPRADSSRSAATGCRSRPSSRARSTTSCRCARGSRRWSPSISTRSRAAGSRRSWSRTAPQVTAGPAAGGPVQRRAAAVDAREAGRGRAAAQQHAQPGAGADPDPQRQPARPQPGRDRPRQGAAPVRAAASRSPSKGFVVDRRRSTTPATTCTTSSSGSQILKQSIAQTEALQSSQLEQLRAAAVLAQQQHGHRPRQPRPAQHPRAGHRRSSAASTSSSASRSSRASGSARSTAPARNKLQADVDEFYLGRVAGRADARPPTSTARPTGSRSRRSIRRSATASSRSTWCSSGPSRRRSSAARPSRPS